VTAAIGSRHCDLNDLVEPLNGRRIEVESYFVTTAFTTGDGRSGVDA